MDYWSFCWLGAKMHAKRESSDVFVLISLLCLIQAKIDVSSRTEPLANSVCGKLGEISLEGNTLAGVKLSQFVFCFFGARFLFSTKCLGKHEPKNELRRGTHRKNVGSKKAQQNSWDTHVHNQIRWNLLPVPGKADQS